MGEGAPLTDFIIKTHRETESKLDAHTQETEGGKRHRKFEKCGEMVPETSDRARKTGES